MNQRIYNILFHTHTVSGIIISVVLYIIFFCGAFALFKNEITIWEKGKPLNKEKIEKVDFDKVISLIQNKHPELYGRDIRMVLPKKTEEMYVSIGGARDSLASDKAKEYVYFNLNTITYKKSDYYAFYSLGELLYRLHFLDQIPFIGIYLSGISAMFLLFAIITGLIIHWNKILLNLFLFRPYQKLKTVWTDAHTALGVIGLPFQFMYAVTSCFLSLTTLLLIPANFLYDGNQEKLMADLRPLSKTFPLEGKTTHSNYYINPLIEKAVNRWNHFKPEYIWIKSYGDQNMKLQIDGSLESKETFLGSGRILYDLNSKTITEIKNPNENNYIEDVELAIRRLHYGDYGGTFLKLIYFFLAFITCFVIISGILIWLEARNKKNIPNKKRIFNQKVGHIYLAICLTLYPVTAFSFTMAKLLPRSLDVVRMEILYTLFFTSWIILFAYFRGKKNNYFTNKYTLLLGSLIGFCIPIVNGISSQNWIWKTMMKQQYSIAIIDVLWFIISCMSLWVFLKIKNPIKQ